MKISQEKSESARETAGAIQWSIATAITLTILKFVTAVLTNSMAIMASALDSLLDAASSVVNLIASVKAAKPPDEDHAYGHEKIESLASLFQSTLIGVSGIFLVAESIKRLVHGTYIQDIPTGLGVMGISVILTLLLTWKLNAASKKSHSLILSTEKLHYAMDLLTNLAAMLALVIVRYTGVSAWDLIFSLLIAAYIFKTAYGVLRRAIDELLDRSLPPVSKEAIEKIILTYHPSMVNLHNFRSRRVGKQIFLDFHIEIQGEDNFRRAHGMTEALIRRIQEAYPGADVTVHYDPEGAD